MLNEIKPPPDLDRQERAAAVTPIQPISNQHGVTPHIDPKEPGLHHARIVGDRTHIDPEYAMPMEDRASNFSLGLTIAVFVIVVFVLMSIFWSFYR